MCIYVWICKTMWECGSLWVCVRVCGGVWKNEDGCVYKCMGAHENGRSCVCVCAVHVIMNEGVCTHIVWEVSVSPATSRLNPPRGDTSSLSLSLPLSSPPQQPNYVHALALQKSRAGSQAITDRVCRTTVALMTARVSDLWCDQTIPFHKWLASHLPVTFHHLLSRFSRPFWPQYKFYMNLISILPCWQE